VYHHGQVTFQHQPEITHDNTRDCPGFRRHPAYQQKTILPASLEALARAREAGYQVIVVTGRHHVAIHPFYQALALDTPAICCNGTYLYDYHAKRFWPPILCR
jgi:phosphoglycolate phosphatase-like HAD superfamily hydrolase